MKGFKNCLAGVLRWVITLVFTSGLILPASNASATQSQFLSSIKQKFLTNPVCLTRFIGRAV